MSAEVVKMCEQGGLPWLEVENGRLTETSKKAADEVFLKLGGRVFFRSVEPMRTRSKACRRGWGELVSELVSFSRKVKCLAKQWQGEKGVQAIATEIRKISGFGGKGFRMKEIVLDLAEVTKHEFPGIENELVDFGVCGPGPRRTLNFVNNRRCCGGPLPGIRAAPSLWGRCHTNGYSLGTPPKGMCLPMSEREEGGSTADVREVAWCIRPCVVSSLTPRRNTGEVMSHFFVNRITTLIGALQRRSQRARMVLGNGRSWT